MTVVNVEQIRPVVGPVVGAQLLQCDCALGQADDGLAMTGGHGFFAGDPAAHKCWSDANCFGQQYAAAVLLFGPGGYVHGQDYKPLV